MLVSNIVEEVVNFVGNASVHIVPAVIIVGGVRSPEPVRKVSMEKPLPFRRLPNHKHTSTPLRSQRLLLAQSAA